MADLGDPLRVIEVTPMVSPLPLELPDLPELEPVEVPEEVEVRV